jgi:hypothetical protein
MTAEEAVAAARRTVEERGWTWREPVNVRASTWRQEPVYEVQTNFGNRGSNALVIVHRGDGSVLHAAYLPR